ncbi:class I adenylate-forming enzyme family protein [uncultured Kordia sp.]|uniref:class I adenylate-forming enzyme family protein n=1 Tax=uncultured Kordia sp. TaxID=507699 RepID=UPI002604F2BD|nr:class I adenylate-forming enzyme family protein [uncultured Kordia sp.]
MIPTLQNFLEASAHTYSHKTAVSFSGNSYTFLDIQKQSDILATYFQKQGVQRGDRIVLLLGNTIETVISFWAILKAGAIVIPVGTELKPSKIEYILDDSGATLLITTNKIALQNSTLLANSALTEILVVDKSEELIHEKFTSYQKVSIANHGQKQASRLISKDLAAIIYTSGSTGEPKGVMLSHENMIAATNSLNAYLGYQNSDKVLCALPLSFDYGLYQMIMSISTGAELVLEKEFTWPIFLLKKIIKEHITIVPAVPTMVMLLHEQNKKYQFDLQSVRAVTNTGAALTQSNIQMVKELFPKTSIFSMYGLTECKRCTYLPPAEIDTKPASVGIAIPNTELWLVDENNQKITTPNTIGQLVIRGATVMQGYWKKPEKTAEKLKEGIYPNEKVLYTGDYCTLDEDGYLYFKARMDQMINSRGIKVSPKEVEDFIGAIPQVNSVVITSVPHKDYGEALFAFVVLNEETMITKSEILKVCAESLETYKVPEYLNIIASIPKTPNGKFNILSLKEQALDFINSDANAMPV